MRGWLRYGAVAFLTSFTFASWALDKIVWQDDFLGVRYDQRYSPSVAGGGAVSISTETFFPQVGGWLQMWTDNSANSVARLRLGDLPTQSAFTVLNFQFSKNLSGKSRLKINADTEVEVAAGFVGEDDPANVAALLYRESVGWILQTCKDSSCATVVLGFWHAPGVPYVYEVRDSPTVPGDIEALIDGELYASTNQFVPAGALVWEWQIWNRPRATGGWSNRAVWIDYLDIQQDR